MTNDPNPRNLTGVAAACILSGGLIAAATIDSHKSVPVVRIGAAIQAGSQIMAATPPITQASASDQFRAQLLSSPKLHPLKFNGTDYVLTDVKV